MVERKGKGKGKDKGKAAKQGGKKRGKEPKAKASRAASEPAEIIAAAREEAFVEESPAAAFAHFRPLAESVEVDELPVFTGQPLLMRANIIAALAAIEPHLPAAVLALREPRLREVFELPALVMALDFASARVPVSKLSAGEIQAMLSEGAPWRALMLDFLEVASHPLVGLLPRERVAAVRAGTGRLDMAQDYVALPGLFTEFGEALAGKHPFPPAALARLGELGGALVQTMRPKQAGALKLARPLEAILRDRFAWLVAERYDHLGVLAAAAVGKRKADALLPALRSSVSTSRTATADAAADSDGAGNLGAGDETEGGATG